MLGMFGTKFEITWEIFCTVIVESGPIISRWAVEQIWIFTGESRLIVIVVEHLLNASIRAINEPCSFYTAGNFVG